MTSLEAYYHETITSLCAISRHYYYEGFLAKAIQILELAIYNFDFTDIALVDQARLWLDYGTRLTYAIFVLKLPLDDALDALEAAFQLGHQLDDKQIQANCLTQFGRAHYYNGFADRNFAQAVGYLETAYQIHQTINDPRGLSETILFLGLIQQFTDNREMASQLFQGAYDIATGFPVEQAYAILHIGILEQQAEQWQESFAKIEEAIALRQSAGFKIALPIPYVLAGDSLVAMQRYDEAHQYYEEAKTHAQLVSNKRALLFAILSLGSMYHELNDSAQARPYLEEARAIAQNLGHERGEQLANEQLATLKP